MHSKTNPNSGHSRRTAMTSNNAHMHQPSAPLIEDRTPAGIRVVTNRVAHVESVTIGVWINAGSREDPSGKEGLAHFLEHAVFKGAGTRDYLQVGRCIEEVGGYIDAWTTKENTCIYVRCLAPHLHLACCLLADLVCKPTFPEEELEKEKEVVAEEIASVNDAPEELIFDQFDELAFPGHDIGPAILGTEESVASITTHDLRQFMEQYYTADNMLLLAIGNIEHDTIMAAVAESFASVRPDSANGRHRRIFTPDNYRPFSREEERSTFQAQILYGTAAPRNNKDFYPLLLLNTILGSGMSSRVNIELREKTPLAYSAYTSLTLFDDLTLFNIYAGTDNENIAQARTIIEKLLDCSALCAISEAELATAKSRLMGAMVMGMEKMSRRMSRAARDLLYFGRLISLEEKTEMLMQVRPGDIAAAATRLFGAASHSSLIHLAEDDE